MEEDYLKISHPKNKTYLMSKLSKSSRTNSLPQTTVYAYPVKNPIQDVQFGAIRGMLTTCPTTQQVMVYHPHKRPKTTLKVKHPKFKITFFRTGTSTSDAVEGISTLGLEKEGMISFGKAVSFDIPWERNFTHLREFFKSFFF